MTTLSRPALLLASLLSLCAPAMAAVRLPAILSDHMVLQRDARVPVWGWAAPGEAVSVAFGKQTVRTRAAADGRWKVELDLRAASATPATLTVRGAGNEIIVSDVLVGEVWLGAGQSNMEKPVVEQRGQKSILNVEAEIAAADHPQLRLFKVASRKATQPADDVAGAWVACSPATLGATRFSAAAYFFGRRLQQELHAPVGMIDSSLGGARIALWTPDAPATAMDPEAARLYNGMIAGLGPFALKGLLWYQGESDTSDSDDPRLYTGKMETLIKRWRAQWQRELPFYYVQLVPHFYHLVRRDRTIGADTLPRMWEAQADALRTPGTGMIVTTDLADDLYDIHPRDKRSVGIRLADMALNQTYQRKDVAASGPVFRSLSIDGSQAVLAFDHAEGLAARDGKALGWFDIAGADGVYSHADARIKDGLVILSSARVPAPVSVRFAWDEAAQPNLVNAAGLPARPFRSQRPPASSAIPGGVAGI
jgi:sialate O-acetylesterase